MLKGRIGTGILVAIVTALSLPGAATAQDAPQLPAAFNSKGVSLEAIKVLPPQADDGRARLMPLHAASVLEWLCGDPNVLGQLGTNRAGCYQEMQAGISACATEMRGHEPTGRSKVAATGRPDIVNFRRQLRQCIQAKYVERQVAAGNKAPAEVASPAVDPLAQAMGGG